MYINSRVCAISFKCTTVSNGENIMRKEKLFDFKKIKGQAIILYIIPNVFILSNMSFVVF